MKWNFDRIKMPTFEEPKKEEKKKNKSAKKNEETKQIEKVGELVPEVIKKESSIDITVKEYDYGPDDSDIKLQYIGERILDTSLHIVFSKEVIYSRFVNNKAQIIAPKGYKLISYNHDSNIIGNNSAVYENIVPVKVKVYKAEDGSEYSPEFGEPLF